MKAIVCTRYGPPEVLQLREVATPTPKEKDVRIKIVATAVTASDCIVRRAKVSRRAWLPLHLALGVTRPRNPILGLVFAGDVEAVGPGVTRFRPGDAVCGLTVKSATQPRFGTYAEYKCLPEDGMIVLRPSTVTYEEAAALLYGGWLALRFLIRSNIHPGWRVLIYGASGAVGTAAVQLAGHFGGRVTGVCGPTNVGLVTSLGAETVLDYTREELPPGAEQYDVIFDAAGKAKTSRLKAQCTRALHPNGTYISVDDGHPRPQIADLLLLKELMETGQVKPVIDRCYPLEQMVAAHRYVETGHKKGNVVITVGQPHSWQLTPPRPE
jgi:NADPH:quinone reductase-like Zn-dependent oxidoreductase